jgi:hypothetical protein
MKSISVVANVVIGISCGILASFFATLAAALYLNHFPWWHVLAWAWASLIMAVAVAVCVIDLVRARS